MCGHSHTIVVRKDTPAPKHHHVRTLTGHYAAVEMYRAERSYISLAMIVTTLLTIVVAALLCSGCAHSSAPGLLNSSGNDIRLCHAMRMLTYEIRRLPIVSLAAEEEVARAADYWNGLVASEGDLLFVENNTRMRPDVVIFIDGDRPAGVDDSALGSTHLYDAGGCTIGARIWLSALETGDLDFLQTIARHEFGHVLGLGHVRQEQAPDLMCARISPLHELHPMEVTAEHVAKLQMLYPERKWALTNTEEIHQ